MSGKPLVSVTMSAYNHEAFVQNAIESVVNQSYGFENIQLIVIDDCSKDNTPAILKDLAETYHFTLFLNKQNLGISTNKNRAIEMAEGKYLCGLASDDYWAYDKIAKQVSFMEANTNIVACGTNALRVDEYNVPLDEKQQRFTAPASYGFADIIMRNYRITTLTVMLRRRIFQEVGLYDGRYKIEDYYMWMKLTAKGYRIHVMGEMLGFYRIHGINTHKNGYFMFLEVKKIIDLYQHHSLYRKAMRKLKRIYFPAIAVENKLMALQFLPSVVSHSSFFYRGMGKLLFSWR